MGQITENLAFLLVFDGKTVFFRLLGGFFHTGRASREARGVKGLPIPDTSGIRQGLPGTTSQLPEPARRGAAGGVDVPRLDAHGAAYADCAVGSGEWAEPPQYLTAMCWAGEPRKQKLSSATFASLGGDPGLGAGPGGRGPRSPGFPEPPRPGGRAVSEATRARMGTARGECRDECSPVRTPGRR
jgi:hypothetical protein